MKPMYVKCPKCGHIFNFYPEGGKLFCPKCLTPADPDNVVDEPQTAADKISEVVGKIFNKKKK